MASEPPFGGAPVPFGAHPFPFGRPTEIRASGTASYFGGVGEGQESPTGNPFAFANNATPLAPPGQGTQPNFTGPPIGYPLKLPPMPATDHAAPYPQHHSVPAAQVADQPPVPHQQSVGAPNSFSTGIFGNQPDDLREDPFESPLYQPPRSKSSQAQNNNDARMTTRVPFSGSVSAPVTGLVETTQQDQERHPSLDGTPSLSKLMSLPMSSSGSSIERPPLSPVLPMPAYSVTNATLPGNQCLPYVQSYPHLPTNATNAAEDVMPFPATSVPQFNTNAGPIQAQSPVEPPECDGLTMKERPAVPLVPEGVTTSQPRAGDSVEMSAVEKDYLSLGKDKIHIRGIGLLEGDQSLSSSLNHSMSSLLDSQEDITQQSSVKILAPAPVARPAAPPSPQPSQQFPPPKNAGNPAPAVGQSHVAQAEETKTESAQTNAAAGTHQSFFPPLHNSSLPYSVSSLAQSTAVSQQPPLHTSPHLASPENPTHSLISPHHHQPHNLDPSPEASSHGEVHRREVNTFPESMPLPNSSNSQVSLGPLSQVPQVSSAPQIFSLTQPPLQAPQPQPLMLQPPQASSVFPPPPEPGLQASMLQPLPAQAVLQSSQAALQTPQVSSVLPPPPQVHASSSFQSHLPPSQERTNAAIPQYASQEVGVVALLQPIPNFESQLQPATSQPAPLDGGRSQTEHIRTESGLTFSAVEGNLPPVASQSNDGANVQSLLQVSAAPLQLPPAPQGPLSTELSNAYVSQTQAGIPSNAHSPQQPPLQYVPSNAHPPFPEAAAGIVSNTNPPPHETTSGLQGPPSNAHQSQPENVQGVLSNAHLSQSLSQSLMTAVRPPPPTATHASSDHVGTQPQHLFSIANTTTTMATPLIDKPPHPQSVPLHQAQINNNLPSTPDSVFSQPTSEAPLSTSNVVTGLPGVSAAPFQTELASAHVIPNVPPKVSLTHTQPLLPTQPNCTVPFSQLQSRNVLATGPMTVSSTSQPQSHSNAAGSAPLTHNPPTTFNITAGPVHTKVGGVEMPTVSSMQPQPIPYLVSTAQTYAPSLAATSTSVHVPPQSAAPVAVPEQRPPATNLPRHAGERQHPISSVGHQPALPTSSTAPPLSSTHQQPHRGPADHPIHPPPHGHGPRGDGRQWRHTGDLQQRERYDPYYGEDPYEYERHAHYYEDPYYYRPRPGSRAPHLYYPDPYEQDPYAQYYSEYDPYTGKYYYVEDPYSYQGEYDMYHRDFYEHPREAVPIRAQHVEHGDPHRRTTEHAHGPPVAHEPAATGEQYPDQSAIAGPGGVFEEGGTFFNSPDARRGQRPQHHSTYHTEGSSIHPLYPDPSHYGPEPPLQADWGSSEAPAVSQPQEPSIVIRKTPEKFACPHVRASFAPGGTLVVVLPHNLRAFQRPEVELSHVTELVSDSVHTHFVRAVSEFPGPLMPGETPKSVAVSYATRQAEQCRVKRQAGEENGEDGEMVKELHDEALLWDFLVLLCQQNGVVVASDISELLTREKATVIPTQSHVGSGDQEDALESIRQLLISGRKRDALELACNRCLWGHALMLASRMDEQSRTYVINRFTASLFTTDPLSTFYTLMLGRTPSAVKPEGLRRAGSWRPHLAMILANRTGKLDNSSIGTLGDSLLDSGRLCAAHFCYHLADMPFGAYGGTTSKYMLLGTRNDELAMGVFPRPEHLRKMEVFEYAMSLGKLEYVLPHFQVFKYLLALQLTQFGMVAKAFKYCEQIAVFIGKSPGKFPPTLLHVVDELSTQLHHLNHPHGVVETELPSWLLQLQQVSTDVMAGNYTSSARSTPSPTFSSVSQAYGQGRHNAFMGQARNQFLKVPGNSYKASSVDSSTATSSKEGSVVGGGLPLMPSGAQQDSYQPSNLLVSQQPDQVGAQALPEQGQVPAEEPYSQSNHQQPPVSGESVVDGPGVDGTTTGVLYYPTQGQVPYSNAYSTANVPSTSGGDMGFGVSSHVPPSSEPHSTVAGSSGGFGVGATAIGDQQPQPVASSYAQPPYSQTSDPSQPQHWQPYPTVEGQQQGQQEQFGYSQPMVDSTQGEMFQPNLQPAGNPSEAVYSGASFWDPQYMQPASGGTAFGGSGGVTGGNVDTNRNTPEVAGRSNREEREGMKQDREEEEEKPSKEDADSKKSDEKSAGDQGKSGGLLSFFMPWKRKTGPPRAKLPSDKEPRIVWDKEKGKWVDLDAGDEDEQEFAPPPTDSKLTSLRQQQQPQTSSTEASGAPGTGESAPPPASSAAPPPVANAYSRQAMGRRGVHSKYVDVMNPTGKNVGGASTQAPPPGMAPLPMMGGGGPPSFFVPQQPPTSEEGGAVAVTHAQPTATQPSGSAEFQPPVATSQSDSHHQQQQQQQQASHVAAESGAQPQVQAPPPPPAHGRHHRVPGDVPHPPHNEAPQPPPVSQPAMPQFFNPSAFAPVSSMARPQPDPLDDTQSTVSEMSQEVSRINSHQMLPASRPPATTHITSYNRLRHGRRVAYPPPTSGHPPRHK